MSQLGFSFTSARPPSVRVSLERAFDGELIVDNFAGGGGASLGIEQATGRPCDIAINHDPAAIAMHRINHPDTRHYCENILDVDPREACGGRPVGLAHFSPDCKHFSRAKGGKPVAKNIRGLAWSVVRWAESVRPRVITLENVQEFEDWGPLLESGLPDPARRGETFREWLRQLTELGYSIKFETMNAADYGAGTTRQRLFMTARRDQDQVRFPAPTHGDGAGLLPYVPAADIINWEHATPSIFARTRPLAQPTLNRIAAGLDRFVNTADPFIVRTGHYSKRTGAGIVPGAGAGLFRGQPLGQPVATMCATNDKNLVVPWLVQNNGGMVGKRLDNTMGTITAKCSIGFGCAELSREEVRDDRGEEVRAFLVKYFGTATAQSLRSPLGTLTTKDRYALATVHGVDYRIVDIGMRMLQPDELYRAQGFSDDYEYQVGRDEFGGDVRLTKTEQIRMVGNSVSPPAMRALIEKQSNTNRGRAAA